MIKKNLITYLDIHTEQLLVLKVEDSLHAHSEGLLAELHRELSGHLIRVEGVSGGVLLVEEVHLQYNRGQVVLLGVELVRGDINLLVEGQGGPFPLRKREGDRPWRNIVIRLQTEDKMLPWPCSYINVRT